ncbi:hypothetical protein [Streptomyces sp. NPDC058157]|uniref:hypothetical protein n=1 Tax=Streptomyces sp. NPDC058157 TaxID=3346360 RepID=UPI0036F03BB0
MYTGKTARTTFRNDGDQPLQVMLEPWGDVHLLPPAEACVVVTHCDCPSGDDRWCGSQHAGEPFQVGHGPDWLTVWAGGHCFHLCDSEGGEIEPFLYGGCPALDQASAAGV